jgi:hypothetical protein
VDWWVIPSLFVAAFGLVIWRGYRRAKQIHELKAHGQQTHGTIVARRKFNTRSGTRWMIVYEYNVDGRIRKHRSNVSREEWQSLAEGQLIALRYLPHRPSVVAPEAGIEKANESG